MVEYRKARREEAADIIDFINYVFSQAHRPHDFKKLNRSMYNSDYPFWEDHYVAVEDGRIRATLSITKKEKEAGGVKFTYGHVGQVSVHPYDRGAGHMKRLMQLADEDMRNAGWDYAELGGLRQRYAYFGYTQGACHCDMSVTPTNTRHAIGWRECRLTARQLPYDGEWHVMYELKDENGETVGTASRAGVSIDDLDLLPDACEAFFRASGEQEIRFSVGMHETDKIRALNAFCENVSVCTGLQYKIFRFKKYVQAALSLRAQYVRLPDGELNIEVDGRPFRIAIENGEVCVTDGVPGGGMKLTALQAQEMLFSPISAALYPQAPLGWFPLTL